MSHPLVAQLRFTRCEFVRCLGDVSEEAGRIRLEPMNCISWIVGHLADHEHTCWVLQAQGRELFLDLQRLVGWGRPATTPPLKEMWDTWRTITEAADPYLDTLTPEVLMSYLESGDHTVQENVGTMLLRNIEHYWFHLGEGHAIRQMLGHPDLPDFVGDMSNAGYRPEGPG